MQKVTFFYIKGCPYCTQARKALAELIEENPAYADVQIDWIEESERPEPAEERDYYYVPAIFRDGEKLYEARPTHSYAVIMENFRKSFDRVLKS